MQFYSNQLNYTSIQFVYAYDSDSAKTYSMFMLSNQMKFNIVNTMPRK